MNLTIFKFTIIKGLRNPMTLILNCVAPIALMFIRALWTDEHMLSGFGLLTFLIWGGSFLIAQGTLSDKESGALTRIMAAPVSMRSYLTQTLIAYMIPLTLQVAIVSILGMVLYNWSVTLALGAFICYTIFTITSVAMSFAWNCLFKTKNSSFSSFSALVTLGIALSGALIPIELLPVPLQRIGAVVPAYWSSRSMNYLSVLGTFGSSFWIGILVMALFSVAFLLYGGKRRMI